MRRRAIRGRTGWRWDIERARLWRTLAKVNCCPGGGASMSNARKKHPKPVMRKSAPQRSQLGHKLRAALTSFLPVIAIVLGTRVALAEAYRIPSGSMEPTLQVGDWLFVNKL